MGHGVIKPSVLIYWLSFPRLLGRYAFFLPSLVGPTPLEFQMLNELNTLASRGEKAIRAAGNTAVNGFAPETTPTLLNTCECS